MSRTFVAREHALSRRVVVKVLSPELLAGVSIDRFKREVLVAAGLQHPHVVPVLSAGDADGLPWFTMPYVEGDSLRARLARGPLAILEITGILRDVARALEFAHQHGVVHRDIKPDNVLLAGSSATVTDFGIAKALSAARTLAVGTTLTAVGTAIGTPAYMAPEQAAGDVNLDHRADIYAFGAMAYELLAGRPPFVADSQARLISAHFNETPRNVRDFRADAPLALADLVMRCLAKDPNDRPQQASALVAVLDTVSSSGGASIPAALYGPQLQLGRALAFWAAAAAAVTVTAWAATQTIGLPDWVFPGAAGVMLAGLPAVLGTWYVQRASHRAFTATPTLTPGGSSAPQGTLATMAVKASPHISWRRTWAGGAVAVGAFATLVVGFMVLRALGIGPMGSLRGAGKFGDREMLVVADFRSSTDSSLGATVAEAIRTDLAQSPNLSVLTRASTREILQMMGRPAQGVIEFAVAREVATREGAKAVLDGEISKLGPSYVIVARLVSARDGSELALFRRTADSDADLVSALGKLSRDIRGKTGESLRDIRDTPSLERVTTASLPALRKYVEATEAISALGDPERGRQLLREAIAFDSTFAMAWRRLAASLAGAGRRRAEQLDAIQKAYRYQDRLTENERLLTEASYYTYGPNPNLDRSIAAYEALVERDSMNSAALNNGATRYVRKGEYARAAQMLERAIKHPSPFGGAFTNLIDVYVAQRDLPAAKRTLATFERVLPSHADRWRGHATIQIATGNLDSAARLSRDAFTSAKSASVKDAAAYYSGGIAAVQGQIRESLRWFAAGNTTAAGQERSKTPLLIAGIDSAFSAVYYLDDRPRARDFLQRALSRVPLQSLDAADRPWVYLMRVYTLSGDVEGARRTYAGWTADTAEVGAIPGQDAWFRGMLAFARGNHADAIAQHREAQRHYYLSPRVGAGAMAYIFDVAGQADSAIAYYEIVSEGALTDIEIDPELLPLAYKRLGELYDAKGNVAKAESYYQRFADLWKNADPELQPRVQKARTRLAELRRARG